MKQLLQVNDSKLQDYTEFSSYFPVGDLKDQTIEAVSQFLPFVKAIKFSKATKELGEDSGIGKIQLNEGRIIATGYPALKKLGIDLDEKPIFTSDSL